MTEILKPKISQNSFNEKAKSLVKNIAIPITMAGALGACSGNDGEICTKQKESEMVHIYVTQWRAGKGSGIEIKKRTLLETNEYRYKSRVHFLEIGNTVYAWAKPGIPGAKYTIEPGKDKFKSIDMTNAVCKPWKRDDSYFAFPPNTTFTEELK